MTTAARWLALTCLLSACPSGGAVSPPAGARRPTPGASEWAHAAHRLAFHRLACDAALTTTRECRRLQRVPRSEMNVYVATTRRHGRRLKTVLPDDGLAPAAPHHAVIAIDPYPRANFGHLVVVVFVDVNVTTSRCVREGGHAIGE